MDWPSLSVIIPSYNQGQYIERTLLSIIKQDYPGELQIIVSDGGSTDETVAVLKKYPQVQWWSERDKGFVDAVGKGLAVATGEVIAIQSSDDYYLEGAFAKALPALQEQGPEIAFVTGAEVVREGEGYLCNLGLLDKKPSVCFLSPGALIAPFFFYAPQHCTFIRRSAIDAVGGLRQEVDQCADFDLWYRLLHLYKGLLLPEYLAVYQKHPEQRTQSNAALWIKSLEAVVESCENNEKYARHFRPTPTQKEETFCTWRINRHWLAGGPENLKISQTLAQEVLKQKDQWSDSMLATARFFSKKPAAGRVVRETANKLKANPSIRRVLGAETLETARRKYLEKYNVNIDWWQRGLKSHA